MSKDQDPVWFWKNFRMGTELQNSGSFLYNAILCLDQMETLHHEEECFEFLYNTSLGLERLFKIALVLIEHDEFSDQEDFEKSLITHSNSELITRIKKKHTIKIGKPHSRFLSLTDKFYKSTRYGRFNLSSVYQKNHDKFGLVEFIENELNVDLQGDGMFAIAINERIKKFLGKLIGKFAIQVYDVIGTEASRNGTFTSEIRYGSKAFKIFMEKKFDFTEERIVQRESLLHILRNGIDPKYQEFIDSIPPIKLESLTTDEYIKNVFCYDLNGQVKDELNYVYEEYKPNLQRIEDLLIIGTGVDFESMETDWLEEE
jgi:hypothetical protein